MSAITEDQGFWDEAFPQGCIYIREIVGKPEPRMVWYSPYIKFYNFETPVIEVDNLWRPLSSSWLIPMASEELKFDSYGAPIVTYRQDGPEDLVAVHTLRVPFHDTEVPEPEIWMWVRDRHGRKSSIPVGWRDVDLSTLAAGKCPSLKRSSPLNDDSSPPG